MTPEVQSLHLEVQVYGTAGREPHGVDFCRGCRPRSRDAASMVRWVVAAVAGPEVSRDRLRKRSVADLLVGPAASRRDAALLGEHESEWQRGRCEQPKREADAWCLFSPSGKGKIGRAHV